MGFEYDRQKGGVNKGKHGIDFDEAQALWQDSALMEIPARAMDEPRWLAIARRAGKCWCAHFRQRRERIQLISVRRARDEVVKLY